MFLHILGIIGIVLACIVAFVLLILLLVLFVPFRYSINAAGENADIKATAVFSGFLGGVAATAAYDNGVVTYRIRALFFSILKGELKLKKDKEESTGEADENAANEESVRTEQAPGRAVELDREDIERYLYKDKIEKEEKREAKKAAKSEAQKAKAAQKAARGKKEPLPERLKKLWEKLQKAKYVWDAPATKRALASAKAIILDLLRHIKPRKFTGNATFGLEDPANTATLYGGAVMVLSALGADAQIYPDFDNKIIKIENIHISGRIFGFYVLLLGLKLLRNKDIKRVMRYIRRNF